MWLLPDRTALNASRSLFCIVFCLGSGLLFGCGYSFGPSPSSHQVLDENSRVIAFGKVHNPTLHYEFEHLLRAAVRDDTTGRHGLRWTSKARAHSIMTIHILHYFTHAAVQNRAEETMKFSAELALRVEVHRKSDTIRLWDSGDITVQQTYQVGEQEPIEALISKASERLSDRLGNAF